MSNPGHNGRFGLVAQMKTIGQQPGTQSRNSKYDPEFCDRVRAYGREGCFLIQIARNLDVTFHTLYNWANKYPEFEDALRSAKIHAAAYWLEVGISNLKNQEGPGLKKFNGQLYHRLMVTQLPELWGKTPQANYDTLERRDRTTEAVEGLPADAEARRRMSKTEVDEAIRRLTERAKHLGE